jgi:hypothetical protein
MNKIKLIIFPYSFLIFAFILFSCTESTVKDDKIYLLDQLDEKPQFKGGYGNFIKYIIGEVKNAPKGTFDSIEDKVFVDFVIDRNGKVNKVTFKNPNSIRHS